MKFVLALLATLVVALASPAVAATKMIIFVDKASQTMLVDLDGKHYQLPVSTGKEGFETPTGDYHPTWLSEHHRSSQYDAPMPYAVFFTGGYAIHATSAVADLGKPASHGCVRLAPEYAAKLYRLVEAVGKENVKIIVQ